LLYVHWPPLHVATTSQPGTGDVPHSHVSPFCADVHVELLGASVGHPLDEMTPPSVMPASVWPTPLEDPFIPELFPPEPVPLDEVPPMPPELEALPLELPLPLAVPVPPLEPAVPPLPELLAPPVAVAPLAVPPDPPPLVPDPPSPTTLPAVNSEPPHATTKTPSANRRPLQPALTRMLASIPMVGLPARRGQATTRQCTAVCPQGHVASRRLPAPLMPHCRLLR
jgi:hypothetical protein